MNESSCRIIFYPTVESHVDECASTSCITQAISDRNMTRLNGYNLPDMEIARARINELAEIVKSNSYTRTEIDNAKISNESDEHFYNRFLTSRKWDVMKADKQIQQTLEWRREEKVAELAKMSPEDILGCPEATVLENFPMWFGMPSAGQVPGEILRDKDGRPIFLFKVGAMNVKKLLEAVELEKLFRYLIWRFEHMVAMLGDTIASGVDKWVVLFDLDGFSMSKHFNRTVVSVVKELNRVGASFYTETLAKLVIINVPTAFSFAWSVVRPLVDPQTRTKICISSSAREEELLQYLEASAKLAGGSDAMNLANTVPEVLEDVNVSLGAGFF